MMNVKRGDIYYADLSPVIGSEQGGLRPVLIIQNDIGNRYSPTVIAAAITSRMGKTRLPTHIDILAERVGLAKDSIILLEQIRTLDKQRLREKMGHLEGEIMDEVNHAIAVSFGLGSPIPSEKPAPRRVRVSTYIAPDIAPAAGTPAAVASTAATPVATPIATAVRAADLPNTGKNTPADGGIPSPGNTGAV